MRAEDLMKKYPFNPHEENGLYIEQHYPAIAGKRADSGCIYYYVRPGERTEFHRIDCDEYWSFNAGSDLELWIIGLDGKLRIKRCGIGEGSEATIRIALGEIFGSRLRSDAADGTFISCITVPRFSYEGFEMFEKNKIIEMFPDTENFWNDF